MVSPPAHIPAGRIRPPRAVALVAALAGLALSALVGTTAVAAPVGSGERHNIVFIQTDDQTLCTVLDAEICPKGADRVMNKTNAFLVKQGTTFINFFATHPRCCPSRASYLTGMYSHNHGILSNKHGYGRFKFHDRALPVWLKQAGYTTAHVGRYMNGYFGRFASGLPVPPGWDEWHATVDEGAYLMFDYDIMTLDPTHPVPTRIHHGNAPEDYQTDVLANLSVDYINRQAQSSQPFYLAINPLAPHKEHTSLEEKRNPRPAPRHDGVFDDRRLPRSPAFNERDVLDKPPFIRRKNRLDKRKVKLIERRYRSRIESLLAADDLVERVVQALAATNQLDNTDIIFTSDNGFQLGEHRLKAGKVLLYEEAVRVPFVARGPDFPAGQVRTQLAGNIDLASTIADIAGADPQLTQDGISLLPLAADPNLRPRRALVLENGVGGSVGVRTDDAVYMRHKKSQDEVYDLKSDPFQLDSLASSRKHRDLRNDLRVRLDILNTCRGTDCQQ